MSKIGKKPILIPNNLIVRLLTNKLQIKGPLGILEVGVDDSLDILINNKFIFIKNRLNSISSRKIHGTIRQLILNMINGVTSGYTKRLNIVGVGYKAEESQGALRLSLGFSHFIHLNLPKNVTATVDNKKVKIILRSIDKHLLGQVAATIRSFKIPEPYNGKGIFYDREVVKKKEGKSAKK